MNQLNLMEIREIEFEILKKLKKYCEDNQIQYFLSNGTLLGAIKYKGFIPWDDDVDIFIPRDDYNRLIQIFKDDYKYTLFSCERNELYRYPFAKLCDMSTRKEEKNINNGVELGVDIDIFPLDYFDDNLDKALEEVNRINKSMFRLGLTKIYKSDSINLLKRIIKAIVIKICKMYGSQYYIKKIIDECGREDQKGSSYMGCKSWCIYGKREIIPSEVFADKIEVEFEGEFFSAPIGYDIYLQSLYGDYKQDPPKEKQKTHHSFTAYRINY